MGTQGLLDILYSLCDGLQVSGCGYEVNVEISLTQLDTILFKQLNIDYFVNTYLF